MEVSVHNRQKRQNTFLTVQVLSRWVTGRVAESSSSLLPSTSLYSLCHYLFLAAHLLKTHHHSIIVLQLHHPDNQRQWIRLGGSLISTCHNTKCLQPAFPKRMSLAKRGGCSPIQQSSSPQTTNHKPKTTNIQIRKKTTPTQQWTEQNQQTPKVSQNWWDDHWC